MQQLKRIAILLAGWFFVGLGLLGLFLPFLQGVLFIMVGLFILSTHSVTVKRWLKHLERRHPQYHERMVRWRERIRGWLRKH